MKYIVILILFFSTSIGIHSKEDDFTPLVGGTSESLQSSFTYRDKNFKNNIFTELVYKNKYKGFIETRNNRVLGSLEIKEKFFYLSLGHRYKSLSGFYLLRDPNFYSSFQNPKFNPIPQPSLLSGFLGIPISNHIEIGAFGASKYSEKKPSAYLSLFQKRMDLAYMPERKLGFVYMNFSELEMKFLQAKGYFRSEWIGNRNNHFGYSILHFFFAKEQLMTHLNYFKESVDLLNFQGDRFKEAENGIGLFYKMENHTYNRIHFYRYSLPSSRETVLSSYLSIVDGLWGSVGLGGGIIDSKGELNQSTLHGSLFYKYSSLRSNFLILGEQRLNRDKLLELKFGIKPMNNWRFEISSQFNGIGNRMKSFYEQWFVDENINSIFTDRMSIVKFKVSSEIFVINWSGSRKKNGEDIFFINVQFKWVF
jgi:hypothetical protein